MTYTFDLHDIVHMGTIIVIVLYFATAAEGGGIFFGLACWRGVKPPPCYSRFSNKGGGITQ